MSKSIRLPSIKRPRSSTQGGGARFSVNDSIPSGLDEFRLKKMFHRADTLASAQARHRQTTHTLSRWGRNDPDTEALTALAGGPYSSTP